MTVVFCDLVGSTELASRFDPEDLAAAMTSYHDCCEEVIERSGRPRRGVSRRWRRHLLRLADRPRGRCGTRRSGEDCTLELVAAVTLLPIGAETLSCRTGIATGLVMVGETKSGSLAHREGAVGETPNLAARAQTSAEAGAVVITPGTRKLIGDRFDLESLGIHELKGIAAPVELGPSPCSQSEQVRSQGRRPARDPRGP